MLPDRVIGKAHISHSNNTYQWMSGLGQGYQAVKFRYGIDYCHHVYQIYKKGSCVSGSCLVVNLA